MAGNEDAVPVTLPPGFSARAAWAQWVRPSRGGDGLLVTVTRVIDFWQQPTGEYDQIWVRAEHRRDGVMAWTTTRAGTERPPIATQPADGWTLPAIKDRLANIQEQLLDKPNTKVLPARDHRQRFAALRAEYHRLGLGAPFGGLADDDRLRLLARVLAQDSRRPAAVFDAQGLTPDGDVAEFAALARRWERASRRA